MTEKTPAARWRENGEPDPHGDRYGCARNELILGDLSDDELANHLFMHGDSVVPGEGIAALTAGKDRIRWLSRQNVALLEALQDLVTACDDYLEYQHSGDPFEEDARAMGGMELDVLGRSPRYHEIKQLLARAKGE